MSTGKLVTSCFVVLNMLLLSMQPAFSLEKVVFGNPNPAGLNIGMAPFYYAEEMGFFKEEGIDVEYVTFNGGAVLDPQVANKSVDIGWEGPASVISSHDTGHDSLPVKFFYNHLRRNVWEIAVPADSKIKTVKDLRGATIGVNSLTTTSIPVTKSILRHAGLDPDRDVSFVAVGMGASAFHAIRSGRIDALNLFDTMDVMLEQTGFTIRRLELPPQFTMLFDNSFFTNVDNLTDKRRQLVGFGRAIAKATVGCYANLPACVHIAWKMDPRLKSKKESDDEAMQKAIDVLEARGESYWSFPGQEKPAGHWGSFTREAWENHIKVLYENNIIQNKDIDVSGLYTNALIPAINDFDTDAVINQAKALK